jgi:hypothetical protein
LGPSRNDVRMLGECCQNAEYDSNLEQVASQGSALVTVNTLGRYRSGTRSAAVRHFAMVARHACEPACLLGALQVLAEVSCGGQLSSPKCECQGCSLQTVMAVAEYACGISP